MKNLLGKKMNEFRFFGAFLFIFLGGTSSGIFAMQQVAIPIPQDLNQMCAQRQLLKNKINRKKRGVEAVFGSIISVLSAGTFFVLFDHMRNSSDVYSVWGQPIFHDDDGNERGSFNMILGMATTAACFITIGFLMKCEKRLSNIAQMLPGVMDARKEKRSLERLIIERARQADGVEWGGVQFNQIDLKFAERIGVAHDRPSALAAPLAQ